MNSVTERALLDLALASCLISFAWGMRKAFVLPPRDTVGMRITATTGAAFAVLQFWIIQTFEIDGPFRIFLALAIYSASLLLFWWAVLASGCRRLPACFTSMEPVELVTTGPYRFIRHPFYASYLLAWSAATVATVHPLLIGSLLVMSVLYIRAASEEERALLSGIHSAAYHFYSNRAGMFLPLLTRKTTVPITETQWLTRSTKKNVSPWAKTAKMYLATLLAVTTLSILAPAVYILVEAIETLPGLLFSQDRLPDYRLPIN